MGLYIAFKWFKGSEVLWSTERCGRGNKGNLLRL